MDVIRKRLGTGYHIFRQLLDMGVFLTATGKIQDVSTKADDRSAYSRHSDCRPQNDVVPLMRVIVCTDTTNPRGYRH